MIFIIRLFQHFGGCYQEQNNIGVKVILAATFGLDQQEILFLLWLWCHSSP